MSVNTDKIINMSVNTRRRFIKKKVKILIGTLEHWNTAFRLMVKRGL
jgi:hypothetical protein